MKRHFFKIYFKDRGNWIAHYRAFWFDEEENPNGVSESLAKIEAEHLAEIFRNSGFEVEIRKEFTEPY